VAATVYVLCAATSLVCAVLLLQGYWRTGVRLLLWSGLCFLALTIDNVIQFADVAVFPEISLKLYAHLPSLVGLSLLVAGMIWETR
jgi:hypothetical protein